jgi:2-C-methyl-D-erythritol 4-phosphate cytidylyltransferase
MTTGAIILAAGRSERMGSVDKLLAVVAGRPLLSYAIEAFVASKVVDDVVLVASEANRTAIEALLALDAEAGKPRLRRERPVRVVFGGERRRDSVKAGLDALSDCDHVVVHDGARPLVTPALIEAALTAALDAGAALCAVPVSDTVKREGDGGLVRGTVAREGLWLAQTPQAFRRDLLLRAHDEVDGDMTDDAAMIETLGAPVRLVEGSRLNIKVTTTEDLALVEAILKTRLQ